MHTAVTDFCRRAARHLPPSAGLAAEYGAFDMNGNARGAFPPRLQWTGVDARAGRGVDLVMCAHEHNDPEGYDLIVSTEMLEHDPFWIQSIERMCANLRLGGLIVLTWASPKRGAHELECSPQPGHYAAPSLEQVRSLLAGQHVWSQIHGETYRQDLDCGLWAVR